MAKKKAASGNAKKTAATDCPYESLGPVQVKCPECGHNMMEPARGRFGPIWRCTNRPACKFSLTAKPTGKYCDYIRAGKKCGALMTEGTKTIPDRCSDKSCPNRNPHKLAH